jgi:hypothetical protein
MEKFVRYVTDARTAHGDVLAGPFQAAKRLEDSGDLDPIDAAWLEELRTWFADRLDRPARFSLRSGYREPKHGVCWFRPSAREHLAKAAELAALLARNGVRVVRVESARPGHVVWADDEQIVAVAYGLGRPSKRRRRRKKKP